MAASFIRKYRVEQRSSLSIVLPMRVKQSKSACRMMRTPSQLGSKQHPPTQVHHTQLRTNAILQEKRPLASIVGVQEIQ